MFRKIPKISFSLLAALDEKTSLPNVLRDIDGLMDMIHYDVSENSKTLHLTDIDRLRQCTHIPFDVHLTTDKPWKYISDVHLKANDYFCIHVENNLDILQLQDMKQRVGCNFGLAVAKETPIEKVYDKASLLDYVLLMTAIPGVSGGQFDDAVIDKVKSFRRKFPKVNIHVDGGVNRLSAALLRDVGVDALISGSYIFSGNDSATQVARLIGRNLHLSVSQIMRSGEALPVVKSEAPVDVVALEISNKKVGCTCVLDEDNKLLGIITDGDLRRQIIRQQDLRGIHAQDIMVCKPFTVSPDTSILQMLRAIETLNHTFAVVPVVDAQDYCHGIIWLQDTLFSEIL